MSNVKLESYIKYTVSAMIQTILRFVKIPSQQNSDLNMNSNIFHQNRMICPAIHHFIAFCFYCMTTIVIFPKDV